MTPFSVLIVEDQARFREAFTHALGSVPDIELLGIAPDLPQGRRMFDQLQPDVLLVDLDLPGGSGIELIRHAAQTRPQCEVMVISVFGDEQHVVASIEAGATGYLLKDTPRERLFPAIQAAARGETVLAPTVATRLVSRMRRPATEALTSREVEVLELVARGSSNADIAAALFISEATVKTHLLHTFAKLGVDDRTAAVVAALERGIIALPRRR
jgi:DNA-binding NarL/FixJ family response regulator